MNKSLLNESIATRELKSLYETSRFGICLLDHEYRYIRLNQYLADINNLPISDHLGRKFEEVSSQLSDKVVSILQDVRQTGQAVQRVKLAASDSHGFYCNQEWRVDVIPITVDDASISFFSVRIHDIAETQQEVIRKNAASNSKLVHEFRNFLAPILTAAQLFKRAEKLNSDGVVWAVQTIENQIRQLTRLMNELGDFSQMALGDLQINKQKLDLKALVEMAVETHRSEYYSHGLGLSVSLPDHSIFISGDSARLSQIMLVVLSRIAKHAPESGQLFIELQGLDGDAILHMTCKGTNILKPAETSFVDPLETPAWDPVMSMELGLIEGLMELHGGKINSVANNSRGFVNEIILSLPLIV